MGSVVSLADARRRRERAAEQRAAEAIAKNNRRPTLDELLGPPDPLGAA